VVTHLGDLRADQVRIIEDPFGCGRQSVIQARGFPKIASRRVEQALLGVEASKDFPSRARRCVVFFAFARLVPEAVPDAPAGSQKLKECPRAAAS
jgi:hypothetical protein